MATNVMTFVLFVCKKKSGFRCKVEVQDLEYVSHFAIEPNRLDCCVCKLQCSDPTRLSRFYTDIFKISVNIIKMHVGEKVPDIRGNDHSTIKPSVTAEF